MQLPYLFNSLELCIHRDPWYAIILLLCCLLTTTIMITLIQAGGYRLPFFVVGGLCFLLAIPISLIHLILKTYRK
jgi:hypothetical protein